LMTLAGGLLYVSTDGDGLAYRTPRVLHWLWRGQWHWIRTLDYRMNIAGCGFEWLYAPLILFTKTDRLLFLINWVSYLLLPGLIFSVFIRMGVRRRVSWWWMWVLSSGWCYVLQAGSFHNDSMAVIYALAAVSLALRAVERQSLEDLWLSLLAAALVTGVKQTDIPLALLWLVAAWPCRRLFLNRPLSSIAVGAFGLLVSALPMVILDLKHTGTWTGIPATSKGELHSPFWGVVGNLFCLPAQNLMPPFFPWADKWNIAMQRFLTTPFGAHFVSFEQFCRLSHSVSDGNAGIGLGICFLILVSFVACCRRKQPEYASRMTLSRKTGRHLRLLCLTPWPLLIVFMAKVGTFDSARQLGPYYVFFFPLLLTMPIHAELLRQQWWRQLGLLVMLMTALLLIMSRSRPLFPAQTLITWLQTKHHDSKLLSKMENSYGFRSSFESLRNIFSKTLPPETVVIGYATPNGNAEPGLALPLGRLKIERLLPDDTLDQLRLARISYVAVDDQWLTLRNETIEQWMSRYDGRMVDQLTFFTDPYFPPEHLYLVQLLPPTGR
jgi:hypothetical protein